MLNIKPNYSRFYRILNEQTSNYNNLNVLSFMSVEEANGEVTEGKCVLLNKDNKTFLAKSFVFNDKNYYILFNNNVPRNIVGQVEKKISYFEPLFNFLDTSVACYVEKKGAIQLELIKTSHFLLQNKYISELNIDNFSTLKEVDSMNIYFLSEEECFKASSDKYCNLSDLSKKIININISKLSQVTKDINKLDEYKATNPIRYKIMTNLKQNDIKKIKEDLDKVNKQLRIINKRINSIELRNNTNVI